MECSENGGGISVPCDNALTGMPPTEDLATPPTELVVPPTKDLVTPPIEESAAPSTEDMVIPLTEELVTPPAEELVTPPAEELVTPPAEELLTPPTEDPPTEAQPTKALNTPPTPLATKSVALVTLPTSNTPNVPITTTRHVIVTVIPAINPKSVSPPSSKTKVLTKKEREELKAERERVKAEMKATREEERLKKEHEKQLREQEKKEKQLKREQQLKERQEKKEREELEKKERKEKREAEKRKKDEEKQKKLDERRKLEQEKEQQKEEKARREQEAKLKFLGFFGKVEKPTVKKEEVSGGSMLTPFSIKDGMSLAGPPREPLQDTSEFDQLVSAQHPDFISDFICTCKMATPMEIEAAAAEDDSVIVVSDPPKQKLPKFKLLQFKENHRPAYYGSWRRARGVITPRNPLKKDEGILDYEVDSDDEWEEEEPGESLSSSEGEEKEVEAEGEDSDEEDDGFFVPHGYLSNDEGDCSDSEQLIPGPGEDQSDTKKSKQLAKAWEAEFARKCQPLKPKVIGCIWLPLHPPGGEDGGRPDFSKEESFLLQFAAVPLVSLPVSTKPVATVGETSAQKVEGQGGAANNAEAMKQSVPEEAIPDLIRFIHKSIFGVGRILKTFRTHWGAKISMGSPHLSNATTHPLPPDKIDSTPKSTKIGPAHQNANQREIDSTPKSSSQQEIDSTPKSSSQHEIGSTPTSTDHRTSGEDYENASKISKRQLEKKIQAIAVKEIRLPITKAVWYVHDAILKQYGLEKDNFAPLVPNGSPFLSEKPVEQVLVTPETPNQQKVSKRKSNYVGKSLLHFLSKSPADKPRIFSPPKRMKLDPPPSASHVGKSLRDFLSGPPADKSKVSSLPKCVKSDPSPANNDVIILDPPDVLCEGPPMKRPCLNTSSVSGGHENEMSTANTMSGNQDVMILDLPASTNDVITKTSPMIISDNLGNGGGVAHDNNVTSSNQGIQCS